MPKHDFRNTRVYPSLRINGANPAPVSEGALMLSITSRSSVQASQPTASARAFGHPRPSILQRAGYTIWRALQRAGQERASRELRRLAGHWETRDPALSRELLEASRFDSIGSAPSSATVHHATSARGAAVPSAA
jgi:hypothetical protein